MIDGAHVENGAMTAAPSTSSVAANGLVQNSLLIHTALKVGGSGIRPKGGSKDIVIRANRVELPVATGRAIQAGGSPTPSFSASPRATRTTRRIASRWKATSLSAAARFSWVNIDGGIVHHNLVQGPAPWVMRILNENEGSADRRHQERSVPRQRDRLRDRRRVQLSRQRRRRHRARDIPVRAQPLAEPRRPDARRLATEAAGRGERRRLRRGAEERADRVQVWEFRGASGSSTRPPRSAASGARPADFKRCRGRGGALLPARRAPDWRRHGPPRSYPAKA